MLKVGDTVKVIAATEDASYCDGRKKEYIPIEICKVVETDIESETMISAEKLINKFEDMANRGTLLCGKNVTQEDLLIQIVGTIVKVSMDS